MKFIKLLFLFIGISFYAADENQENEVSSDFKSLPLTLRVLNPAKGSTVWIASDKEETIFWVPYGDLCGSRSAAISLEGEFEITASPFTWNNDALGIRIALYTHMSRNIDLSYHGGFSFNSPGFCQGEIYGESVEIKNFSNCNIKRLLPGLENEMRKYGGRRVYVTISDDVETSSTLKEYGYSNASNYLDLETGAQNTILTKELGCEISDLSCDIVPDATTIDNRGIQELSEQFGVFVRNSAGTVLGGIVGTLKKDAAYPHAVIDICFMNESIRGNGLGRKIINHTEKYVKSVDTEWLALGTDDSLATGFYEKCGFNQDYILPRNLKLRSGEYINVRHYVKHV